MNTPRFHTLANIGKVRHAVSYHDGLKTHADGSPFFDLATMRNKRARDAFCKRLRMLGYVERNTWLNT
jgi:hypothetical protein